MKFPPADPLRTRRNKKKKKGTRRNNASHCPSAPCSAEGEQRRMLIVTVGDGRKYFPADNLPPRAYNGALSRVIRIRRTRAGERGDGGTEGRARGWYLAKRSVASTRVDRCDVNAGWVPNGFVCTAKANLTSPRAMFDRKRNARSKFSWYSPLLPVECRNFRP